MGKYILKKVSFSEFNETGTKETKMVNLSSNPKKLILKKSANTKEFSTTEKLPKTFKLKRETKNFGVLGNVVEGIGNGVRSVVDTGKRVVGGVSEGVGKGMDSFVGKNVVGAVGGGLLGTAAGLGSSLALGPLGLLAAPVMGAIGGIAGRTAMSAGGKLLKGVGSGLKSSADASMMR